MFSSAANIFFMREKILEYLNGDNSNRLLRFVKFDMETPEYVAGCKALGLVSYFITTLLWCLVEDMNVHIMDLPPYCREMITYIDECIEKTETFIEGGIMLSFSHFEENVIYRSLIKPWQHDGLVISILKSVLTALSVTVRRLFADYLDANFENSSDIEREKCRAVPKHNKFSESIFGHADRLLREKPSTIKLQNG